MPTGIYQRKPLSERLWNNAESIPESGCMIWMGGQTTDGYGQIEKQGKEYKTHRIAWEVTFGPIPKGMCVCHHCDTKLCINPRHLFIGTDADNVKDRDKKNRQAKGENHGNAKLIESQVKEIKLSDKTNKELSKTYKVSNSRISEIKSGKTWSHVEVKP